MLDYDVLIAGAGPTGMAAAIALQDAGLKVMIIDRHETGLSFSRAILVNSQTLSLLRPYGVADKIMAAGRKFSTITINGPNGVIIEGEAVPDNHADVRPTALPQLDTEKCFVEELSRRGVTIDRPCALKSFEQNSECVESIVERNGETRRVRSAFLLGADGFHSTVRERLGFDDHRSLNPLRMYSQDAVIDWAGRSDITLWILDAGAAFAMKISENMVRFAATNKQTFVDLGFRDKIEKTTWESEFDVYFAQVDRYGDKRIWLAGDAAHVHSPVGGRGMNMGIADGVRFAQAVVQNDFLSYQNDRHAVSSNWVRKNQLFTKIMTDQGFIGRAGRLTVRSFFRAVSMAAGSGAAKKVFEAITIG